MIGFEIYGIFDQMSNATEMGINIVFQFILAARAVVITGAMSRATTAGRIPINILLIVSLFFIYGNNIPVNNWGNFGR
jgi:hypothetical protein